MNDSDGDYGNGSEDVVVLPGAGRTKSNKEVVEEYFDLMWMLADDCTRTAQMQYEAIVEDLQKPLGRGDRKRLELHKQISAGYLGSDKLRVDAIEYAAERIAQEYPELVERFEPVPCAVKYGHLLETYQFEKVSEIKSNVDRAANDSYSAQFALIEHENSKPAFWSNLATLGIAGAKWETQLTALTEECDKACAYARKMEEYWDSGFPFDDAHQFALAEIGRKHSAIASEEIGERRESLARGIADDPVATYHDLVRDYALDYVGLLGRDLLEAERDLASQASNLDRHDHNRPGVLMGILSGGRAAADWRDGRAEIIEAIADAETRIEGIEALRREAASDGSEAARDWARNAVADLHPEVVEAFRAACDFGWDTVNRNRVERRAEREPAMREESGNGVSR